MVRLRTPRRRRGLLGKLRGDPIVEAAAAAVFLGLDPAIVLDAELEDLPLVQAVLQKAQEIRVAYDGDFAEAIGAATGNRVVGPLAKHITRLVRAIRANG